MKRALGEPPVRVLITRAEADAGALAREVIRLGGQAVCVPAVRMEPLGPSPLLEQALQLLPSTQAIAFASRYGVRAWAQALQQRQQALPAAIRLFAVGPSTGAQVAQACGRAAEVSSPHTAQGLAQTLLDELPMGARVLLPTAQGAGGALHERLTLGGLEATLLPLYCTVGQDADAHALTKAAAVDYIVFTSPSCVASWVRWGRPSAGARLLTMGPSTSRAVRAAGATVSAEATPSSFAGLTALLRAVLCPSL